MAAAGAVATAIERWFPGAARDLPWRKRRTPYRVLVSEAMLQQTQVSRVAERFPEFMARFPNVQALAKASLDEVLAAWQGLGYYRRARLLHAAAKVVAESHRGRVPSDPSLIRGLPGVGRYTAGAIASLAFGLPEPIVDGNVIRVVLRLDGRRLASDDPTAVEHCWSRARELVEGAEDPARLNEGLMELGATVCTPASPRCGECPLRARCVSRREGTQLQTPLPKSAARRVTVHHHAVAISQGSNLRIRQRGDRGLWARMWELPTVESPEPLSLAALAEALGVPKASLDHAGEFLHRTTHRDVVFRVHRLDPKLAAAIERIPAFAETVSVRRRDLGSYAMGVAQQRTIELALGPYPVAGPAPRRSTAGSPDPR